MPMMQPMGMPGAPMFPPQAAAHAQMVFTTTQRPQAKMGGQQTRTYNILPMISFKVCRGVEDGARILPSVEYYGNLSLRFRSRLLGWLPLLWLSTDVLPHKHVPIALCLLDDHFGVTHTFWLLCAGVHGGAARRCDTRGMQAALRRIQGRLLATPDAQLR